MGSRGGPETLVPNHTEAYTEAGVVGHLWPTVSVVPRFLEQKAPRFVKNAQLFLEIPISPHQPPQEHSFVLKRGVFLACVHALGSRQPEGSSPIWP